MKWVVVLLSLTSLAAEPVRETLTRGSVTATIEIDSRTVALSGTLRVTLRIEGASPLKVTLPKQLLVREVASFWRIRPDGAAKTEPLAEARERFEQRFEISPYRVHEAVPFRLAEIVVHDGTAVDAKRLDWANDLSIAVETRVTDPSLKNLRLATSIETLPDEPSSNDGNRNHLLLLLAVVAVGAVVYWWPRRRNESELAPHTKAWTRLELERLGALSLPPAEWCERFAFVLRRFIEREKAIAATRLTSEELVRSLPELPPKQSELLGERLRLGDQIRFSSVESSAVLPFNPQEWISWSVQLIETLSPEVKLGDLHEVQKDGMPK